VQMAYPLQAEDTEYFPRFKELMLATVFFTAAPLFLLTPFLFYAILWWNLGTYHLAKKGGDVMESTNVYMGADALFRAIDEFAETCSEFRLDDEDWQKKITEKIEILSFNDVWELYKMILEKLEQPLGRHEERKIFTEASDFSWRIFRTRLDQRLKEVKSN